MYYMSFTAAMDSYEGRCNINFHTQNSVMLQFSAFARFATVIKFTYLVAIGNHDIHFSL